MPPAVEVFDDGVWTSVWIIGKVIYFMFRWLDDTVEFVLVGLVPLVQDSSEAGSIQHTGSWGFIQQSVLVGELLHCICSTVLLHVVLVRLN